MSADPMIDAHRVSLILNELRLPTIKHIWGDSAVQADKEGWPADRFLAALAEHELAERDRRGIERHLEEAHLPARKPLDCFAFDAVPMISNAKVMAALATPIIEEVQPLQTTPKAARKCSPMAKPDFTPH